MSYLDLDILSIHKAIIEGKVTPIELTKEAIKRAKEDNNNCFEYICENEAIYQANHLDITKKNNLLWGIPYCLKDNFSTKGIPTCASSDTLKGYIPNFDAEVYTRLKEQGAILIGKNTMDEFAMGGRGDTCHIGKIYNPKDPSHERLVGGSSSGSVSAVCAGIVPFSVGSDTGDSVRKPVSYAGVTGLKPTWGRISRFGLFPFAPSLDHVGIITKYVYDSAIILNALAGKDDKDTTCSSLEVEDYCPSNSNKTKYKICIIKEIVDSLSNKKAKDLFLNNVEKLKASGVEIDYASYDINLLRAVYPTYMIISCVEVQSNLRYIDGLKFGQSLSNKSFEQSACDLRSTLFHPSIKKRLLLGGYIAMNNNDEISLFSKALKARTLITNEYKKLLDKYDAVFVPSAAGPAPKFSDTVDRLSDEYLIADNHMPIQNMGGFPSITLPLGNIDNLPFGGNIACNLFEEKKLLEISHLFENIFNS